MMVLSRALILISECTDTHFSTTTTMARLKRCGLVFIIFICGIGSTLWMMKVLNGWSWYHLRMRTFLSIAAYRARDASSLCYSADNKTVVSCELAAMTRLIKFRFTKDLLHNVHNKPQTIIPYSRNQMDILWINTFPYPTHLPISVTLNDNIHHYNALWVVNRKNEHTNAPLTATQLNTIKHNLRETGVIVAIHGGALVMGAANHLVPPLTLLSSFMGDILNDDQIPPPILAFDYRLAPECAFPCQTVDVSFIINKYLHEELGVAMNKIYLIGSSSGGSLALLFMQKLAYHFNYNTSFNVGAAVLISPGCDWTLNDGKGSWETNDAHDPVIFYESIKLYRNYAFGIHEVDAKGNKILRKNDTSYDDNQCEMIENKIQFESPKISACYGSFDGLPSLYITVSELEALFDDAVTVYKKANNGKNQDVKHTLEVNYGSSLHELPLMAGVISEATNTLRNVARFLVHVSF
eukprot:94272_1